MFWVFGYFISPTPHIIDLNSNFFRIVLFEEDRRIVTGSREVQGEVPVSVFRMQLWREGVEVRLEEQMEMLHYSQTWVVIVSVDRQM